MPPELSNPQAELALLAAAIRASNEQRVQMAVMLREEWFSASERVVCWRVMQGLIAQDLPVDVTLLKDSLRGEKIEGRVMEELVGHLSQLIPTATLWKPMAERVHGYYVRRKGYQVCLAALERFKDLSVTPDEALEQAESELFAIHADKEGRGMNHVSQSMIQALDSIQESVKNRGYVNGGIPTGFTDLDRTNIKGMRPGHVIIAGAPPGGGKTVFLMNVAYKIASGTSDYDEGKRAKDQGRVNYLPKKVGIFSLEMDDVQLTERLLITEGRVALVKTTSGMLSKKEMGDLADASQKVKEAGLYIEHCPGISIQELRVKARYNVMRHKLDMICIDYAQLITSSSKGAHANRTQEMMDVSKGLKLLAQECRVPVLVLAQPKQETWGQRAPLSALGETSQLSKDADLVLMLGSWDIIMRTMKIEKEEGSGDDEDAFAYIDVVKNRHGGNTVGKMPIKLRWEREFFEFQSTNHRLLDASGGNRQES